MDLFDAVLSRPAIIGLAIAGGLLATIGGLLKRGGNASIARALTRAGYALAWLSVAAFVVAGFRV